MSEIDPSGDLRTTGVSGRLRPTRLSAGEVTYPPGGRLGPRWQHDIELVLVHTGSARVAVDDDRPLVLRAESVALLLPGHRESFEFDAHQDTHHSWVQLGVEAVPDELMRAPRVLPTSTALTALVRETVAVARAPAAATGQFAAANMRAPAEQLAASLAAAASWRYVCDAEARVDGPADAVELARRHLDLRLGDPDVNLGSVAAAAHVTPAHVVRRFRAELGTTPMAYLWRRRVAEGVDLLTNTGLPVGEIARRSGFRSVYHFSRRVKHETGLPPTELRRQGWSQTGARPSGGAAGG